MQTSLPLLIAPAFLLLFVGGLVGVGVKDPVRAWLGGASARQALERTPAGAKVLLAVVGFVALQGLGVLAALLLSEVDGTLAALAAVAPLLITFALFIRSARRRHRTLDAATRESEDSETREHARLAWVVLPVMIAALAAPELGDEAWLLVGLPFVALLVGAALAWRRGARDSARQYLVLLLLTPLLLPVVLLMTWWEVEAPFEVVFFVQMVIVAPVLLLGAGALALFRWVGERRAPT
jgi:hypothetical protein